MYICINKYILVHTYIHTYIHTSTCTYIHTMYIHTYIHLHVYIDRARRVLVLPRFVALGTLFVVGVGRRHPLWGVGGLQITLRTYAHILHAKIDHKKLFPKDVSFTLAQ
jgi:hypothetical protein